MVSLLDCIKRVPSIVDHIIDSRDENFKSLFDKMGDNIDKIDEIIFIGSGTSNTSAITAKYFTEKASGIRVTVLFPNEFLHDITVRNKNALYVFTSQTGTSIVTKECLEYVKNMGFLTAAISESGNTPIAKMADIYIDMGCGREEYPTRTIGYSSSVLVQMLLGLEMGRKRNYLTAEQYNDYVEEAKQVSTSMKEIIEKTMSWMDFGKRKMLRSTCIIFTGVGSLYGVSLEGAVKVWEIPQIVSAGYELEEGIHGPNYGYNHNHCVIVLNDGGRENQKATALASYMKNEMKNGFVVGVNANGKDDLSFEPKGGAFLCLEFAAVVQVIAYRLGHDGGRDLFAPHNNSVMESYFVSHSEKIC